VKKPEQILIDALTYYAKQDNWQKPDQFVPYWTLWDNGDCIEGQKAREALNLYYSLQSNNNDSKEGN